jgi:ClpP class serine protease
MAWLLKPEILQAMRDGIALGVQPTLEERARFARAMDEAHAQKDTAGQPRNMQVAGSTAEISVEGVLTEKPDCFALLFGGGNTTYAEIRRALALADSDPAVKDIVLNVSSPGGHVTGLFETFAAIEATKKPISVKASMALSAAYGLAALAGPIEATTPGSEFGSIGVAAKLRVEDGVVNIASTNAPRKRPDVSTDEGVAMVREELDAIEELFVDTIARGRSLSAGRDIGSKEVMAEFGQGGTLLASASKKRGMIDRIAKQPRRVEASGRRAEDQTSEPERAPEPTQAADSGGAEGAAPMNAEQLKTQHPETYKAIFESGVAAGTTAGTTAERERVTAHLNMGKSSGNPDLAVKHILSGAELGNAVVQSEYLGAAMNSRDQQSRQQDSDGAGQATGGAAQAAAGGGTLLDTFAADNRSKKSA